MKIYAIGSGAEEYMAFRPADPHTFNKGVWDCDGVSKATNWQPYEIILEGDPKKERIPDISVIAPGSYILNENAADLLRPHLEPYGELLPVSCSGEPWDLYNVTTVVKGVLDFENSRKLGKTDTVLRPAFFKEKINQNRVFRRICG